MRKPQVGDLIEVVKIAGRADRYYSVGCRGKIINLGEASFYVDFKGQGNPIGKYSTESNSCWHVARSCCKVVQNSDVGEPIPFDLTKAKAGESVITRSGEPVKFLQHVFEADEDYRVVVLAGGRVNAYSENGVSILMCREYDLFMAPEEMKTIYINTYASGKSYFHDSEGYAKALAGDGVGAVQIAVKAVVKKSVYDQLLISK